MLGSASRKGTHHTFHLATYAGESGVYETPTGAHAANASRASADTRSGASRGSVTVCGRVAQATNATGATRIANFRRNMDLKMSFKQCS